MRTMILNSMTCLIALAGAFAAAPAIAQDVTATGQRQLSEFATCIVKVRKSNAEAFLSTAPFTESANRQARRLAQGECLMEGEVVFNTEAFRGVLYRAMYRAHFGGTAAPDVSNAPQLDYTFRGEQPIGQSAEVLANLRRFADCVVRQDPAGAQAVVVSDFGSDAEGEAFQRITPAMSACLTPGHTLAFKRPMLKGVIAETLYRVTAAKAGRPLRLDRR